MADVHKVVFYPVGNGDTTQIVLSGGRRVLFDFCQRDRAEDTDTPEIDLKSRLKDELKAVDRDYFDVVAFTHADLDHCRFQKTAALNVRSRLHYSSGGVGSIRQRRAAAGHQRTQGGLSATGRSMRHRWPSRRGSESARIDLRCPTSH